MKEKDIPQANDKNYEGHTKIRYGRAEDGSFVLVKSTGCEIEKAATSCAWDDIKESLELTRSRVLKGELSPLAFHMEKALLTPELLAQNIGLWTWKVKQHLKPKHFIRLSEKQLKIYSDYLEISVETLKSIPEDV
jgi:hypothetical protein